MMRRTQWLRRGTQRKTKQRRKVFSSKGNVCCLTGPMAIAVKAMTAIGPKRDGQNVRFVV